MDLAHWRPSTASSTQSMETVLMVAPSKMPWVNLPPLDMRKIFGRPGGCVGFEAFDGPRAEDDHAVGGFAAHHFLPGPGDDIEFAVVEVHGEDGGGGVAEDKSFALLRDPVEVGDADAGGGAVVGEDDVVIEIDGTEVGKFSVVGFVASDVLELELLDHISDPGRAERFPGANVESARAEEGPHGHLNGAGVGGRYDTADIAIG